MNRRGVSPVVATVLLLVLTIVIGGVVFSVVIPFVKDSLGNSKECLDVFEGVEFPESKFNCYNITAVTPLTLSGYETGFSMKLKKDGITGFRVSLIDANENSDVIDIKTGAQFLNIKMIKGTYNQVLDFPSIGGQRTYVSNKKYAKAEVSPISKSGDVCAVTDTVEFTYCYNDVVF